MIIGMLDQISKGILTQLSSQKNNDLLLGANLKQKFDNLEVTIKTLFSAQFDEFMNTMMVNFEDIKSENLMLMQEMEKNLL